MLEATLICAWCELRNDVRHFRTDRVVSADVLDESFSIPDTVIAKMAGRAAGRSAGCHTGYAAATSAPFSVDITRATTTPGTACLGAASASCEAVYYSGSGGRCNTLRGGHETRIGGVCLWPLPTTAGRIRCHGNCRRLSVRGRSLRNLW